MGAVHRRHELPYRVWEKSRSFLPGEVGSPETTGSYRPSQDGEAIGRFSARPPRHRVQGARVHVMRPLLGTEREKGEEIP